MSVGMVALYSPHFRGRGTYGLAFSALMYVLLVHGLETSKMEEEKQKQGTKLAVPAF